MRTLETETTIAQGLHTTDDSAGYDAACKRVLSEKAILARIMKACLSEYQDCDVNDIAEKYIEGKPQVSAVPVLPDEDIPIISGMDTEDKSVHEGTVTYDIRFRAIVPCSDERIALIINVEAQNDFYPGYPIIKRGIYYCCRMISSQYGREFTSSNYDNIKKVYSIWICMNPPKKRENTITRYRLVDGCKEQENWRSFHMNSSILIISITCSVILDAFYHTRFEYVNALCSNGCFSSTNRC